MALLVGVATGVSACNDPSEDPVGPDDSDSVPAYMSGLPSWSSFAPVDPETDPAPSGSAVLLPDTIVADSLSDDGSTRVPIPPVTYRCTETPYSMARTPDELVMYSPDQDILWPGALIQGRGHKDPLGSLLSLTIAQRTPIRVSIPEIPGGSNFREVDAPSQATVAAAISEMVGDATTAHLATPSSISYEEQRAFSASQFALAAGISGKYMGLSASAQAGYASAAQENTVSVHFTEKMFTALIEPPQTPSSFFSDEFTADILQQQVDQGNIGPDNIPVYVSKVVYGRMMLFTLTGEASSQDMRAAVNAAYRTGLANVEASLRTKYQRILQKSRVTVQTLGGSTDAALALIRDGNTAAYFEAAAELSTAVPLSYEFRALGGGNPVAAVTESTDYVLRECTAEASTPGTFNLRPGQDVALPFVPDSVLVGDATGNGLDDLILNELDVSNRIAVAYSDGAGAFTIGSPITHPDTPAEGWANFDAVTGDFDGDGLADLAWSHAKPGFIVVDPDGPVYEFYPLRIYVAFAEPGGNYSFLEPFEIPADQGQLDGTEPIVVDVDGDGNDDLVWVDGGLFKLTALSDGEGGFTLLEPISPAPATAGVGVPPARDGRLNGSGMLVGELDGAGGEELVNVAGGVAYFQGSARVYSAVDGRYPFEGSSSYATPGAGWTEFTVFLADVDNRDGDDLVWFRPGDETEGGATEIWTLLGNGAGGFVSEFQATQQTPNAGDDLVNQGAFVRRVADFNGDGRADIVWNSLGAGVNRSFVGLGLADGTFDFSPVSQTHPESENWSLFELTRGDFNGDGRVDLLWLRPGTDAAIYVALGRS